MCGKSVGLPIVSLPKFLSHLRILYVVEVSNSCRFISFSTEKMSYNISVILDHPDPASTISYLAAYTIIDDVGK